MLPSGDPLLIEGGNTEETYTQEKDTAKYITERKGEGKGLGKGEGGREGKDGEGRNGSLVRSEVNGKGSGEREGREWSHTSTIRTND